MRRRRKKRTQLSVSLFPFLAVLICTLGVLIVMLVMAVKSADDQANQVQSEEDAEKAAKIQELQDDIELRRIQLRGMESVRPDTLERVGQSRANRSYLEDEIRKLNKEFERVGIELLQLERQPSPTDSQPVQFSQDDADDTLNSLRQELEIATAELATRRKSAAEINPASYVIVPHKGGGGTFRRPIYIECTRDAIILQPSGIRLTKDEFVPPLDPGNVLDSALLSNREYWQRYDLAGDEGSPYPLIVVRPDGAETFVLARRAMMSWDEEFGYELVESDKVLDFGKNDPQLNAELNEAILEARRRQRAKMAFIAATRKRASQFGDRNSRPGLTASGRGGGFVSAAGSQRGPGGTGQSEQQPGSSDSMPSDQQQGQPGAGSATESMSAEGKSKARQGTGGDLAIRNPNEDQSLAKQRGTNWALPSQTAGATGYVRPIRLYCGPDYLELKSANGEMKRIPIASQTQAAIDPLVDQVWRLIDSWGISGANSFWKPQLRVTVLPGGQQRFHELNGLLHQSGLTVQEMRR